MTDLRYVLIGFSVISGLVFVGFGMTTGPEAGYWIHVEQQVDADDLVGSPPVLEYDSLEPRIQDAFRETLETGDDVRIQRPPEEFGGGYVHYRDHYYEISIAVGDANTATMWVSIVAGIVLVAAGCVSLYAFARRSRNE